MSKCGIISALMTLLFIGNCYGYSKRISYDFYNDTNGRYVAPVNVTISNISGDCGALGSYTNGQTYYVPPNAQFSTVINDLYANGNEAEFILSVELNPGESCSFNMNLAWKNPLNASKSYSQTIELYFLVSTSTNELSSSATMGPIQSSGGGT